MYCILDHFQCVVSLPVHYILDLMEDVPNVMRTKLQRNFPNLTRTQTCVSFDTYIQDAAKQYILR